MKKQFNSNKLGWEIYTRRYTHDMSAEEVAYKAKISKEQLKRIEKGTCIPRLDTACRIAKAIGCNMNDFYKWGCDDR